MKRILTILCCGLLLIGCTPKQEEVVVDKEEVIDLVSNETYDDPKNPSNAYKLAYNELSKHLMEEDMEKVSEDVAICFVYDFFTLKNKENSNDIGGLTYLPQNRVDEFYTYALHHYYINYDTIVNKYGKESLPEVVQVHVDHMVETTVEYLNETYQGYEIDLSVEYADSKLSDEELKTSIKMTCLIYNMKAMVIAIQ